MDLGFPLPPSPEHSGLLWRVEPSGDMRAFIHPPAVTREALCTWERRKAKSSRCAPRMADAGGGPVAAPPLVASDTLFVAHEDESLRAIDRFRREEVWKVSPESPSAAPFSYAEGKVYAQTQDGRLYVIR